MLYIESRTLEATNCSFFGERGTVLFGSWQHLLGSQLPQLESLGHSSNIVAQRYLCQRALRCPTHRNCTHTNKSIAHGKLLYYLHTYMHNRKSHNKKKQDFNCLLKAKRFSFYTVYVCFEQVLTNYLYFLSVPTCLFLLDYNKIQLNSAATIHARCC